MYYVYEWFIVDTNEVIYVGKGSNKRYKVRKHNRFFNDMVKKYKCESRIIKRFKSEEDAFNYEYKRINELREIGQCVCNIYDGGFGGTTSWWTDDRRKYYSDHNVMKLKDQRKRMSLNNPMKDHEVAAKTNSYKRRPVIIDGREYESITAVADEYMTSHECVDKWCNKGKNPYGETCRYKDSKQVIFKGKRYNKGGCRPLRYKGKEYESPIDLAEELKLHHSTVCRWAKRGYDPEGNECRYLDDSMKHEFKKGSCGDDKKKPIWVNGVWYPSKADAEKQLGLSKGYLSPYIAGTRKNKKYICVYDNQHPSQTKSDKSSLEGSETNE